MIEKYTALSYFFNFLYPNGVNKNDENCLTLSILLGVSQVIGRLIFLVCMFQVVTFSVSPSHSRKRIKKQNLKLQRKKDEPSYLHRLVRHHLGVDDLHFSSIFILPPRRPNRRHHHHFPQLLPKSNGTHQIHLRPVRHQLLHGFGNAEHPSYHAQTLPHQLRQPSPRIIQ